MEIKIPYGLKGTKLAHISEVNSGLACQCVCPACSSQLIARKRGERQEHFAHHSGSACSSAVETTLHLFAKEVLEKERKFMYPSMKRNLGEFGLQTLISEKEIVIDKVYLEKKLDTIIPDVILEIKGKKIFVEIAVTHFIDNEKRKKIEQIGISTIEIDLSKEDRIFDQEVIKQAVVYGSEKKSWVFNAQEESRREKLLEKLNEKKRKQAEMILNEENRLRNLKSYCFSQGFDKMNTNENNEFICPKKSMNSAQQIKSPTEVVKVIENGGKWNGVFYGRRPNGKYIFIDRNKYWIYSPDSHSISNEELKKQNLGFAQLGEIKRKSIASLKECEQCPFFVDYIGGFDFFCRYRVKKMSKNE